MADPILLVEDDNADSMLIIRAFRKAKISNPVERVDHGDAAVDYLNGSREFNDRVEYPLPVLILLDLKLPRRSGFEVLAWIRNHPGQIRRIPVVVLTSSAHNEDINRAYDLGANSYLVKPGNPEILMDIVQSLDSYWLTLNSGPELQDLLP